MEEQFKSFLIVGESLDGVHSFQEFSLVNILTSVVLLTSTMYTFSEAIRFGDFWWLLVIGFALGGIYFLLSIQQSVTYAITKYRIIRLEKDIISKILFGSSRLTGFTDLHYEHVESINIGPGTISASRFYVSLAMVSLGWIFLDLRIFEQGTIDFINLMAILLIVAGIINVLFSLPLGGVRLIVQSISGDIMEFPESKTPTEFVNDLIMNCRTFLSYGAI